jgi:hypothetical protein
MGDPGTSSEDEIPLGERKKLIMALGRSSSHNDSPSNYCPIDSQLPNQSNNIVQTECLPQSGEFVGAVSNEAVKPDDAATDEKGATGAANPNQRPRRQVASSKGQSRTSTSSAAPPPASRGASRDSVGAVARGRGAGRGGSRGFPAALRRGRGRRGRYLIHYVGRWAQPFLYCKGGNSCPAATRPSSFEHFLFSRILRTDILRA